MGTIFSDTVDNGEIREDHEDEILEEPTPETTAASVGPRRRRRQTQHRSRAGRRKTARRTAVAGRY
jgi:hypothetical protein